MGSLRRPSDSSERWDSFLSTASQRPSSHSTPVHESIRDLQYRQSLTTKGERRLKQLSDLARLVQRLEAESVQEQGRLSRYRDFQVLLSNPMHAPLYGVWGDYADNISKQFFGHQKRDATQRDAFRHGLWFALLGRNRFIERDDALTIGIYRERDRLLAFSSQQDYLNNAVGYELGANNRHLTPGQLTEVVRQAVLRGDFWIYRENWSYRERQIKRQFVPSNL